MLPLFAGKHLPFTDLPEHVAVVSALFHYGDAAFHVQEHYAFAFPRSQYVLFHVVAAGLTFIVRDPLLATRLLLVAVGVAYPFSLRALLVAMKADERLAVFGALVFWNRTLTIGFLPFVASVPLLVYALAVVARDAAEPSWRKSALLGGLGVCLFYMHLACFIELVGIAIPLTLLMGSPRRLVWLAPPALAVVTWLVFGRLSIGDASLLRADEIAYMSPRDSLIAFPLWIHDIWQSHVDELCAVAWWGSLLAMVISSMRGSPESFRTLGPRLLPIALAVLVYFAMPYQAGVGVMLNVRLAPLLALFAVIPLKPKAGRWTMIPVGVAAAATIVMSISSAIEIAVADRDEVGDLDELLARAHPGSNMLALNFDTTSRHGHFSPWLYAVSYHRIRTGGVTAYSFASLAHWPMHFRKEGAPPHKNEAFWATNPCVFRNADDGPFYEYVLVRGTELPFRDEPAGPRFRAVGTAKTFTLYERTGEPPWTAPNDGPCVK